MGTSNLLRLNAKAMILSRSSQRLKNIFVTFVIFVIFGIKKFSHRSHGFHRFPEKIYSEFLRIYFQRQNRIYFQRQKSFARFCYRFVRFLRERTPSSHTDLAYLIDFLKKFTPHFCAFTFSVKNASTPYLLSASKSHLLSKSKVILFDFAIDLLDFCASASLHL